MEIAFVLILVDERELIVRRRRLTGGAVFAAVAARESRGDVLIREDNHALGTIREDQPMEIEGGRYRRFASAAVGD